MGMAREEGEEKLKVLLGQDTCMEGGEKIDSSVKSYLRKVNGKLKGEDAIGNNKSHCFEWILCISISEF